MPGLRGDEGLWHTAIIRGNRRSIVEFDTVEEGDSLVDFFVHDDVFLDEGHFLAVFGDKTFDDGRAFQRTAEFQSLCGVHQFDGKDMVEIVHDFVEFRGCIGSHADVVFLSVARHDGVAAGGITIHLVLADHRCCGVLRNHKSGIQSGVGHEEFGQPAQAHDELCDAPFGDVAQFGQSYGEIVVDQCERLSVEVASRDDKVFVGEDSRVVSDRVDFCEQDGGRMTHSVFCRPVHLRDAAEGVGVLDVFLGLLDEFASFEDAAECVACLDLSFVRAHLLDAVHEGVDTSVESFERHGCDEVGPFEEASCLEDGEDTVGAHELRPVQEREPFFTLQLDGFPTEFVEDTDGLTAFAFVVDVADADEWQEEVGQWGEVARCAERTAVIDDGEYVVVEEVDDALDGDELYAAVSQRESVGLEQEHELDDDMGNFSSDAACMALDEVFLQRTQLVG